MRLLIVEGQDVGRILPLGPDGLRIGRGHDNDLPLPEEGVSRRHCFIHLGNGSWVVEDLNSTNGVTVNGQRISGTRVIGPGDRIGVGKHLLVVEDDLAATQPPVEPPAPAPAPEPATAAPAAPAPLAAPTPLRTTVTPAPQTAPATRPEPLWDDGDLPPRRRIPWVRLALLGLLVGAIAVLAFVVFRGAAPTPPSADQAEATRQGGTAPPREVSDAELARLIAAEERAGPKAGAATAGSGATTPAAATNRTTPPPGTPATERTPPVTEAGRAVVSDLVFVASDPPGATVLVDGTEKGVAPLLVRDLEKGRHRIVLKLAGYEDFERQIHVPDLLPSRPYALRARPGTLYVTSSTPGTAIWRGPQLLGVAPVLLQGLPPGPQDLVLVAPGCEPVRRTVTVSEVSSEQVEVAPKPLLGALELITQPPGCSVVVEGTLVAVSQPAGPNALVSAPVRLDSVRAGAYAVLVEHPLGVSRGGKLTVKPGETVTQTAVLWVPDSRVVFNDGTVKVGMIIERNEQGDIVLAETPDQRQWVRYLKPQMTEITPLPKEAATEILRKQGLLPLPGSRPDPKTDEKTDPKERPRDGADRRGAEARGGAEAEAGGWGDAPAGEAARAGHGADAVEQYTVGKLLELLRQEPGLEVVRRLKDRRVALRDRPTGVGKEGPDPYLAFDRRIRCYLNRDFYEVEKDAMRQAAEAGTELEVTGGQAGMRGDLLVLKDCEAKPVPKDEDRKDEGK